MKSKFFIIAPLAFLLTRMPTTAIFYNEDGLSETQISEWTSLVNSNYTCETRVIARDVSPLLETKYFHMIGGYTYQFSRVNKFNDLACSRKVAFLQAFDFVTSSAEWTHFFDEKFS